MALSRKTTKHKRSVSYSGGIFSSLLSSNGSSVSEDDKAEKVSSVASGKVGKVNNNSQRMLARCYTNMPTIVTPESNPALPISPMDKTASDCSHFTYSTDTTQEMTERLQHIEQGLFSR